MAVWGKRVLTEEGYQLFQNESMIIEAAYKRRYKKTRRLRQAGAFRRCRKVYLRKMHMLNVMLGGYTTVIEREI